MLLSAAGCAGNGGNGSGADVALTVGTGGPTGTYYAYVNTVGSELKAATGYSFDVLSTGGSVANLNGLDDGDYNMAIVQNDTMLKAYNGLDAKNFPAAITSFSVMGEVYSEVIQIVVSASVKDAVRTVADLRGLRVSVGDAGSGTEANSIAILEAYGIRPQTDITMQNLSVGNSADAMKDGKLDAFFFTAGTPTTAITELSTAMDIGLLSIDAEVADAFISGNRIGGYDVYAEMEITHDQYAFIPEDRPVRTLGVTATFIVSDTLPEDVVYRMTRALWERKDAIAAGHAIGKSMRIENALATIGNVPVHPGAARYYSEAGLL